MNQKKVKQLNLTDSTQMISPKVLIAGKCNPILINKLTSNGYECEVVNNLTKNYISKIISRYDILIVRSKIHVDKSLIDLATNLKIIGRIGAGLENIDIQHAKSKGIITLNSPEGNKDALAEHSIGMILALMNNLHIADIEAKKGKWEREKNRGHELKGKTIGIIGYGNMGSAFAQRLIGFNVNVIAYDKYKKNFSDKFVKECTLQELFSETDILSINLPLTTETHFLINDSFINSFTKNIYLINTSRGDILKTKDLISNIYSKKITGAALDVLEYESGSFQNIDSNNNEFNQLISFNNIIISPHIAGWSVESEYKLSDVLANKILSTTL